MLAVGTTIHFVNIVVIAAAAAALQRIILQFNILFPAFYKIEIFLIYFL